MDAYRLFRVTSHFEDSHPPDQSANRVCRLLRPVRRRQATSAASSRAPTAGPRGGGRSSATHEPAAWTSPSIRTTRTSCSPRCGRRTASSIRCRAAAPAAGSSSQRTVASTGPRSRALPACRAAPTARSASRSPAPIPTVSTRSSKTTMADFSVPTMPAQRGSW